MSHVEENCMKVFPGLCLVIFGFYRVMFGEFWFGDVFYIFCLLFVGVFACPLFLRLLFAYSVE